MSDLIRCKDCIHIRKWRSEESAKEFGQIYECACYILATPSPNDFCSKAKRKNGDRASQLITADDAKKETQKVIDAKTDDILNETATKIQDSIRKGGFFCYINKPFPDKVISILRENGYTVKDVSNQFDGCCIKIGWKRDEED